MKKIRFFVYFILSILSIGLFSCSQKLPENDYEKVKFAFDGVEKSFQNQETGSKNKRLNSFIIDDSALSTIKGVYGQSDNQGDVIDDLEYNQPPMIQFQCLKKVFESIGSSFTFNEKYYDTIEGDCYIDMDTGKKGTEEEMYQYHYEFVLAMLIHINENDLIHSDISFNITVRNSENSYNTKWYVSMDLIYDMNNFTPNYNLTMLTNNDQGDLPYKQDYVYEYDYVDVKEDKINEWRKFCFETDRKIDKDSNHQTFDTYIDEGVSFNTDTCKWYYDKSLYKITRNTDAKSKTLANAFFKLGLNNTNIDGTQFINASGNQNNAIKNMYQEFSRLYKEDIIYSLMTKEEHHQNNNAEASIIRLMSEDGTTGIERYTVDDCRVIDLFTALQGSFGTKQGVRTFYAAADGTLLDEITDFTNFEFKFKYLGDNDSKAITATKNQLISELYQAYKNQNSSNYVSEEFIITIISTECEARGDIIFRIGNIDTNTQNNNSLFPKELKDKIPEFKGDYEYEYHLEEGVEQVTIKTPTELDIVNYIKILLNAGYTEVEDDNGVFKNKIGDGLYRYIKLDSKSNIFFINTWTETITINPGNNDNEPSEDETIEADKLYIIGDYNDWDLETAIELSYENEVYSIVRNFYQAEKFKIVLNRSWENGGYGYSHITNEADFSDMISLGDSNNIVLTQNCIIDMEVYLDESKIARIEIIDIKTK